MEDLVLLDEIRIIVGVNIDYIQICKKDQNDDEKQLKIFKDGNLVWIPKDPKIKEGKFLPKKLHFFIWYDVTVRIYLY